MTKRRVFYSYKDISQGDAHDLISTGAVIEYLLSISRRSSSSFVSTYKPLSSTGGVAATESKGHGCCATEHAKDARQKDGLDGRWFT